ncbi:MAG: NAD(P)H-binding protein [Calditrichia bacterium]
MENTKILVIGGTGKTGRKVVERLTDRGISVRVGSRNATPAFDWNDPSTWADALNGINAVYITFQPDLAVPGAKEAIAAFTDLAVNSGIQKIVLLSGKGETEAELCEQIVMNAGVKWTIVRASWFFQNFSESFFLDPIIAGHVALPKGDMLIPFVDTNDIADVAVAALLDDQHAGQIYELTGPRQLTFKQITREIAAATGRNIQFSAISMDEYTSALRENHVPEDYIWLVEYLFTEVLVDKNSIVTNDVQKVLGRKATDFAEFAATTAATGVWNAVDAKATAARLLSSPISG